MAILEPDLFEASYKVMPKFDRRTKQGKADAEAWEQANAASRSISQADMDTVLRVHQQVYDNDFFAQFFKRGLKERSFFCPDARTGLLLRCRPDNLIADESLNVVVDLKSTDCADEWVFTRDILKYGYVTQGAFYMDLIEAATGRRPDAYVIVAVEKSRDCDVQVFFLGDEALRRGSEVYRGWLDKLAECIRSNRWPGYEQKFIEYVPPDWFGAHNTEDGDA